MRNIPTLERFQKIANSLSKHQPILVVGDVGIDKYTKGVVKRVSPEAPVPLVEVKEEWLKLGLAANISDNLHALNIDSTLCGVIGDDQNGNVFENLLEEKGLSTWGIVRSEDRPTTFKERVITDIQQIARIDYESNEDISSVTRDRVLGRLDEFVNGHKFVILEDYGKGTLSEDLLLKLIPLLKQKGLFIGVDPSRSTPPLFYKGVHFLKPNRDEAQIMTSALGYGEKSVLRMAEILVEKLSLEKVVITLGPDGMAMLDTLGDGKVKIIPTVAKEVFDVSGAGDTSMALIMASLQAGATLEEASWICNCGAGVVVGKKGTATVNLRELTSFFKDLHKKIEGHA